MKWLDFLAGFLSGLVAFAVISTMGMAIWWDAILALILGSIGILLTNAVRLTMKPRS
jgi:hypothetical protein